MARHGPRAARGQAARGVRLSLRCMTSSVASIVSLLIAMDAARGQEASLDQEQPMRPPGAAPSHQVSRSTRGQQHSREPPTLGRLHSRMQPAEHLGQPCGHLLDVAKTSSAGISSALRTTTPISGHLLEAMHVASFKKSAASSQRRVGSSLYVPPCFCIKLGGKPGEAMAKQRGQRSSSTGN
ncbi:hypothetical protein Dimus_018974 [Dionaea muscipula]